MAAFGEESDLTVAFSFEFKGVALPMEIVRALGLQMDAAALMREVGVEVKGRAGQGECDAQGILGVCQDGLAGERIVGTAKPVPVFGAEEDRT